MVQRDVGLPGNDANSSLMGPLGRPPPQSSCGAHGVGGMNSCGSMHGVVIHENSFGVHANSCVLLWRSLLLGLLQKQVLKISQEKFSQEVEIVPGCAVTVARPSCPDHSLEPPGPGRVIRNPPGWSQLVETARSGVWLFRGALQGKNVFLPLTQSEAR